VFRHFADRPRIPARSAAGGRFLAGLLDASADARFGPCAWNGRQIANLGLRPLVSLTDHDNIDAGLALEDEPISVEWTVPYERSIVHLGIHNLPPTPRVRGCP